MSGKTHFEVAMDDAKFLRNQLHPMEHAEEVADRILGDDRNGKPGRCAKCGAVMERHPVGGYTCPRRCK